MRPAVTARTTTAQARRQAVRTDCDRGARGRVRRCGRSPMSVAPLLDRPGGRSLQAVLRQTSDDCNRSAPSIPPAFGCQHVRQPRGRASGSRRGPPPAATAGGVATETGVEQGTAFSYAGSACKGRRKGAAMARGREVQRANGDEFTQPATARSLYSSDDSLFSSRPPGFAYRGRKGTRLWFVADHVVTRQPKSVHGRPPPRSAADRKCRVVARRSRPVGGGWRLPARGACPPVAPVR